MAELIISPSLNIGNDDLKLADNNDKTCYSDAELLEFKELIERKLDGARKEVLYLQDQIKLNADEPENKMTGMESGAGMLEKEYLNQMASRQMQYIQNLENALIRIHNKTYGICRVTGKLIPKDRLRAVPHATLSIDAKKAQKPAATTFG